MRISIGSRGSPLALWQANWVKTRLESGGHEVEIKIVKTTGDKLADVNLTQSGTKGLFIKEIEEALLTGAVDVAAHSLKDLPTEQPEGLTIAVVPPREDARDVFISRDGKGWAELAARSRVGTSSLRRQTQLRCLRRELEVIPFRGNVETRLKKLDRGDCDALVLAAAGLHRLGLSERITEYFSVDQMCPAVGQGALAIEIRRGDEKIERAVEFLDHAPTHQSVRAERTLLRALGGGCQLPIAAYADARGGQLHLRGVVAGVDGTRIIRAHATGSAGDPERLGERVAQDLLQRGARSLLA